MTFTYKDAVCKAMEELAAQPDTVFIGQGLNTGDRVYGTMSAVPTSKCVEMPCAENLHVGVAIGLALRGLKPIVVFQRMDFILCAADAIINHLSLMPRMSGGQFKLPVIIRAIVGPQDGNFVCGPQHNKDFSELFMPYLSVNQFRRGMDIQNAYSTEYKEEEACLMVEYKDCYGEEIKNV